MTNEKIPEVEEALAQVRERFAKMKSLPGEAPLLVRGRRDKVLTVAAALAILYACLEFVSLVWLRLEKGHGIGSFIWFNLLEIWFAIAWAHSLYRQRKSALNYTTVALLISGMRFLFGFFISVEETPGLQGILNPLFGFSFNVLGFFYCSLIFFYLIKLKKIRA